MQERQYLAIDMGASSGRHLLGRFAGERLTLDEVYRFENGPVQVAGHWHWDVLDQWKSIQAGLRAAADAGHEIASLGIDTWGVDFALLGRNDELVGHPYHYRDRRTDGMLDAAFAQVAREEIFAETGLQFMQINSLYQLLAMKQSNSPVLEVAERLLMMPDLFHWMLTGEKSNELTDVSTSQLYNPQTGNWSMVLIEKFGFPAEIFGELTQPGTPLGHLRPEVIEETGLRDAEVVLPATHDTASAVIAVPASGGPMERPDWCYISSGTWSLMGVEVPRPVITETCARLNFTNEGGVGGTSRPIRRGGWST